MEKARLSLLRADIEGQLEEVQGIYEKIHTKEHDIGKDEDITISVAYLLHNLYCAFEDLFKIVAFHFENRIEDEFKWHSQLLKRMTVNIKGIRPAFISHNSLSLFDELMRFRHVFRHAYSYKLDVEKVKLILQNALTLEGIYKKEVEKFLSALEGEAK